MTEQTLQTLGVLSVSGCCGSGTIWVIDLMLKSQTEGLTRVGIILLSIVAVAVQVLLFVFWLLWIWC